MPMMESRISGSRGGGDQRERVRVRMKRGTALVLHARLDKIDRVHRRGANRTRNRSQSEVNHRLAGSKNFRKRKTIIKIMGANE